MESSDLELLQQAANGENAAFHSLVDRHAKDLFRLAMTLSRSRLDAEDIVQETFAGAFQGLRKFAGRSSVKTWLTRILIRRAAKHWHQNKRLKMAVPLEVAQQDGDGGDSSLSSASMATRVDYQIDIMGILKMLSEPHRQVIVLREMQGMSYQEIAEALDIPRGTVESRLYRARLDLQQRLKDYVLPA